MIRLGFFLCIFTLMIISCSPPITGRLTSDESKTDFNFDWRFTLVDDSSSTLESNPNFDDLAWRKLDLPHDWSIEGSYDSTYNGATGYLPGGTGWYRKTFNLKALDHENTYILFDGVYNNSELWLNGKYLGQHPYGYSPFYFDVSNYLNADGRNNVLAVKVDRTRYIDSRWYTGSGIYRNVKLISQNKLHITVWGSFLTTPEISKEKALVNLELRVLNNHKEGRDFRLETKIYDGSELVAIVTNQGSIAAENEKTFNQTLTITSPKLWDLHNPHLYTAETTIIQDGRKLDEYKTPFGIRSLRFDADMGFFLNGENIKIKGVCLHHDGGLVGSAVPKGVWRRRLEILKNGGCNAIRIAHNPSSEELLDLCDEMGLLVQDEFFDEWDYPKDKRLNQEERHSDYISRGYADIFQEWAQTDLKNTMLAHRNHPSIFQWSIGNEIEWAYHPRYRDITGYFNMNWKGNYFWELPPISPDEIKKRYSASAGDQYELARTAKKLAQWTRELDTTRYITANCILPSASHVTGYADALDVVGYSYRRVLYDYGHKNYPGKVIMGTENLGQWHEWKSVMERDHISGLFLWTGIDYLGESYQQWPRKATPSGLLDVAGFTRGSYHMMKSLWVDKPHIHIATQKIEQSINKLDPETGLLVARDPEKWKQATWVWQNVNNHWNYELDEMISVEVYSNCEELELFLNEEGLGARKLADFEDHIYKWAVPYVSGKLEVKGSYKGEEIVSSLLTAGEASTLSIHTDKNTLKADGYDVAHIVVQVVDETGVPVKSENREVQFKIEGEVEILGLDNGSERNVQDHQSNKIRTAKGRCLLIIQSKKNKPGRVAINAISNGLESQSITLTVH